MLKPRDVLDAPRRIEKLLSRGQEAMLRGDCVLQLGGDNSDELVTIIK